MQTKIWDSPQVGGSGGALKALTRNVANHLKLNRTSMKRVVAQVVAEHHTLGEVADYKGHMYFAKPDRLNFNELITQSKEAFDDFLLHEPRSSRKRTFKPRATKIRMQKKVSPPQMTTPPKKGTLAKRSAPPMRKGSRRRKSSTTIFQLAANAGRRSLNGVIIDDTHLKPDEKRREILLHVPPVALKRSRRRLHRAAAGKGGKLQQQQQQQQQQQPKQEPAAKKVIPNQKKNPQEENVAQVKKQQMPPKMQKQKQVQKNAQNPKQNDHSNNCSTNRLPNPSPLRSPTSGLGSPTGKPAPRAISAARSVASIQRRQSAQTIGSERQIAFGTLFYRSSRTKVRRKPKTLQKEQPVVHRNYDKPWLVGRSKRRLVGGYQIKKKILPAAKPQSLDEKELDLEEKMPGSGGQSNSVHLKSRKRTTHVMRQMRNVNLPWYTPYQFQGGAGATQTPSPDVGIPPHRLLKAKTHKLLRRLTAVQPQLQQQPLAMTQMRRGSNFTKRQRHDRSEQERLMRELQREEAIDDPLSHGSGLFRGARRQMSKKQQQDHRSVERVSSRTKRLSNDRRQRRQPMATSERIVNPPPTQTPTPPPPPPKQSPPNSSGQVAQPRRRNRSIPVDSSLGSIALLGLPPSPSNDQRTPAKCHLTIAFRSKGSKRAKPINQPWK